MFIFVIEAIMLDVFSDVGVYCGEVYNGVAHGFGTWTNNRDRWTYIGYWKNNEWHGYGTYTCL